jgi:hypothetical protein
MLFLDEDHLEQNKILIINQNKFLVLPISVLSYSTISKDHFLKLA